MNVSLKLIFSQFFHYKVTRVSSTQKGESGKAWPVLSTPIVSGPHHSSVKIKVYLLLMHEQHCITAFCVYRLVSTHLSLLGAELSERPCYQGLWEALKDNEPLMERIRERGTSSQATVLQSLENPQKWLVVGNTHLYFHPDADHVRLLQSGQTILFIEEIVNMVKENVCTFPQFFNKLILFRTICCA